MNKRARPVTARFLLVQTEETADNWTDPEITEALSKFLNIWAGTVDAEVDHLFITVLKSGPAPDQR